MPLEMKLTAITLDCPDPPAMAAFYQQATDLDEAEARVLELGAAKPGFQPGGGRWRVLTDPAGHPFCLTLNPPA